MHIWNIDFAPGALPVNGGLYADGQLYKTVINDEAGGRTVEFKDKEGHIILKKVASSDNHPNAYSGWLSTYYVYDDQGNLRFVMQPMAVVYLFDHSWTFDGTDWSSSTVAKGRQEIVNKSFSK